MAKSHPLKLYRDSQRPQLSQADLAVLVGVSRATVNRWERGRRPIDLGLLPVVAKLTKIPAGQLRPDLAKLVA